jgi:hypothetical protein
MSSLSSILKTGFMKETGRAKRDPSNSPMKTEEEGRRA